MTRIYYSLSINIVIENQKQIYISSDNLISFKEFIRSLYICIYSLTWSTLTL